jgi:hypothetical protein
MTKATRIAHTVLSLGFNLVIERLGLNPRWRYAVWALIVANEVRGLAVAYQIGSAAL